MKLIITITYPLKLVNELLVTLVYCKLILVLILFSTMAFVFLSISKSHAHAG